MTILPNKTSELLSFCNAHVETFTSNAVAIGITAAKALAFKNASVQAQLDFDAAIRAENTKKAAVSTSQQSARALRKIAADTIAIIKAFAENAAVPSVVYNLANLPMPAMPGPIPAPGTPTDFVASIDQSGAVKLTWKCPNPSGIGGTIYEVRRRTGANTNPFNFVGFNGKREFVDGELPAGSTGVTYKVIATRSTLRGNPAEFNVNFGVSGGGGMFIASTSMGDGEMKMAA